MIRLDPVATLLTLICLGCSYLLYLDRQIAPGVAAVSELRTAVAPRSVENEFAESLTLPKIVDSDESAVSAPEQSVPAHDASSGPTREISVQVSGLKDQPSVLYIAVFESGTGFPKPENSRSTTTHEVSSETVEFSLSLPGNRSTAIAVFQDLNGDGRLTKNDFGLPVEPYGFSNNARSLLGPPSFSQAAFMMNDELTSLEIRVR